MEWRPIPGYEMNYEVSDSGWFRRVNDNRPLKVFITRGGYGRVFLYKNSVRKSYFAHRLVAKAFLGEPPASTSQVNHKDGRKLNNAVDNLEWCTQSENIKHSYVTGLREENKARLLEVNHKEVNQYTLQGDFVKTWFSLSEAARALNLSVSNICNCCKGRINSTGGYTWRLNLEH